MIGEQIEKFATTKDKAIEKSAGAKMAVPGQKIEYPRRQRVAAGPIRI